jgi:hypothetical protein
MTPVLKLLILFFWIFELCCLHATANQRVAPLGLDSQNGTSADGILEANGERVQLFAPAALSWNSPVAISSLAFRVDDGLTSFSAVIPHIEIRMSTSSRSPATMAIDYASNVGSDEKLMFSADDVALASPGGAGPNAFGLQLQFSEPFFYNPANGSLLFRIDVSVGSFFGSRAIDSESGGSSYKMVAPGVFSVPVSQALITQFEWVAVPEPTSMALLVGVGILVASRMAFLKEQ